MHVLIDKRDVFLVSAGEEIRLYSGSVLDLLSLTVYLSTETRLGDLVYFLLEDPESETLSRVFSHVGGAHKDILGELKTGLLEEGLMSRGISEVEFKWVMPNTPGTKMNLVMHGVNKENERSLALSCETLFSLLPCPVSIDYEMSLWSRNVIEVVESFIPKSPTLMELFSSMLYNLQPFHHESQTGLFHTSESSQVFVLDNKEKLGEMLDIIEAEGDEGVAKVLRYMGDNMTAIGEIHTPKNE